MQFATREEIIRQRKALQNASTKFDEDFKPMPADPEAINAGALYD